MIWLLTILVLFSPNGGCEAEIVKEVASAKQSIRVQAYYFTNPKIADALIAAHAKKVDVKVILDGNAVGLGKQLSAAGIPLWLDSKHAIAHNKIIIIDHDSVLTGSYNFTVSAEHANAENLVVIHNRDVTAKYWANWVSHLGHSQRQ